MPHSNVLKDYSPRFAEQALSKHPKKGHFTGQDLLTITESKQVNLLILWNLKDAWEFEKASLTSSFFDYDSEQVKSALKNLMNALSQNIKVSKEVASQQIQRSVDSCLALSVDPSSWISGQLEKHAKPAIDLGKLRELGKYLTFHKGVLDSVIREADVTANKHVLKGDLTRMLYQNTPMLKKASDQLRSELSSILEIPTEPSPKPEMSKDEPKPQNLFEEIEASSEPDEIRASVEEEFEPEPEPEIQGELDIAPPAPEPEKVETFTEPTLSTLTEEASRNRVAADSGDVPMNEPEPNAEKEGAMAAESSEPTQFYRKLQGQGSFYATIKDKNIKKLSESISMALKFRFISGLFNNQAGDYQGMIDQLEKAGSSQDALGILQNEFAPKLNWSMDSEIYQELEGVVKRRFQNQ